ncbi:P-loop containing nucleoside triphosphate hydrolase protein [Lineolata rhizophorae]|uniref:P-loop containing nucleoside triphosphate hydrolase protein n=1 Tax=Lineolata rhizophorae TaxID=578093 RepID=A0A6A6P9R6_9PEZI|nr:P-loop containing nucleoside triphosphate hydrolase protein [Lineolata rhizophorae]
MPTTLLVGVSGPSSSGKTTLARLLRDVFPNAFILHEDDFYKTDAEIPLKQPDGIQDWDCLDALDLPGLRAALAHIKARGAPPPDLVSKEDQNAVGDAGRDVPAEAVSAWRARAAALLDPAHGPAVVDRVAIVDGFLLYAEAMRDVRALFDVRLFLRASYGAAKARRETRNGYVTLEGFWEDPPGYVDKVVWPNYVRDHAFLFEGGDVHARLDEGKCRELGIDGMPDDAQESMARCLEWACGVLHERLKEGVKSEEKGES